MATAPKGTPTLLGVREQPCFFPANTPRNTFPAVLNPEFVMFPVKKHLGAGSLFWRQAHLFRAPLLCFCSFGMPTSKGRPHLDSFILRCKHPPQRIRMGFNPDLKSIFPLLLMDQIRADWHHLGYLGMEQPQ